VGEQKNTSMERYDIINEIIQAEGLKTYLEIGLRNPDECFNLIECSLKWSVDPGYESGGNNQATYHYESDEFFEKLRSNELDLPPNMKWDLIFVDGLHISDQVYRDFLNAKEHISSNGYIVFHDCNPPTPHHAREDYRDYETPASIYWNGTVWKAMQKIRTDHFVSMATVSSDWGVGIVRFHRSMLPKLEGNINPFYDFNKFEENRKEILNLIDPKFLKDWIYNI